MQSKKIHDGSQEEKKAKTRPTAEAEKEKDRKIERAREIDNKTNYNMKYMYHVILGRF